MNARRWPRRKVFRSARGLLRVSLVIWLVFALLGPSGASAHDPSDYFRAKWRLPLGNTVTVVFTADAPSAARSRTLDAANRWNARNRALRYQVNTIGNVPAHNVNSCPHPNNQVRPGAIDGTGGNPNTLAQTHMCRVIVNTEDFRQNPMTSFTIVYDSAEPWYTGTGTVPAGQYDLLGVMVHELGHGTGWFRHYDDGASQTICPTNNTKHVMCRLIEPANNGWRTLKSHDTHTFDPVY